MLVRPANSPNSVNSFIHPHFYFFKFSQLVAIIFNRFIRWKTIFTKSSILESSPLATWSLGFSTLPSLETCNRQVLATIFDHKVLCSEFCGIAVFSFLVIRFVQLLLFTACWLIAVLHIVILAWKCIFESFTKKRNWINGEKEYDQFDENSKSEFKRSSWMVRTIYMLFKSRVYT